MTIYQVKAEYWKGDMYHSIATESWQICSTETAARQSATKCRQELQPTAPSGCTVRTSIYVLTDTSDGVFHANNIIYPYKQHEQPKQ